ncbi:hypothetical protein [Amycolatopsis sp.]|jgi:hypothetical protein|uniref:hypothetical protein n=1 Tax=Amycolatopsis sp. TaxID=37632 RepID=UPI002DF9C2AE|nr:hypothetical protein [Amycolatopsis sp.]
MVMVSIPGHEPQSLRAQTIRELFFRARERLADKADHQVLFIAEIYSNLELDSVERAQQRRLAGSLIAAADEYRADLLACPDISDSDLSRAEALGDLSLILTSLAADD